MQFLVLHLFGASVLALTGRGVRTGATSLPASWGTAFLIVAVLEVAAVAYGVIA